MDSRLSLALKAILFQGLDCWAEGTASLGEVWSVTFEGPALHGTNIILQNISTEKRHYA